MARAPRTRRRSADYQAPAVQTRSREERRREREAVRPVEDAPRPVTEGARELPAVAPGARNFLAESWGELKKVDWPGQRQLISATVAVIVAIAVVGAFLWGADAVFSRLVRDVLLNV